MSNYSVEFLSKDNVTEIFKNIIQSNNLNNISSKDKQNIVNNLIPIVKSTFKTLDMSKISARNLSSVKKQFNNICATNVLPNIQDIIENSKDRTISSHNRKSERDFNTFNRPPPNFREYNRPEQYQPQVENMQRYTQPLYNNPPRMNNNVERPTINVNTDNMSLTERLKMMEEQRNMLTPKQQVPEMPDHIKPVNVNKNQYDQQQSQSTFDAAPSKSLSGISNFSNFGSFQSTSKKQTSDYDENISVADRLAQMELERSKALQPNNNQPPPQMNQPPPQMNQPPPQMNQPPPQMNQPPPQMNQQPQMNQPPQMNQNEITNLRETILNLKNELEHFKNNIGTTNSKNVKYLQLEIDKYESEYSFNFNNIENVIGINLASYSLPPPYYNFNNGELKYYINNDNEISEHIIKINKGYYDFLSLLQTLNNSSEHLEFSFNNRRRLVVKNKIQNSILNDELVKLKSFRFDFNNTLEKLGFNMNPNFVTKLEAYNLVDLRTPSKVILYIKNLMNEPYGILNFNGSSKCNITFNKPITLNSLDIIILDENNELYNFENLKYNLSFQLLVLENNNQVYNLSNF